MKWIRNLFFGTAITVVLTAAAYATPPSGAYSINQNGTTGTLIIQVSGGSVSGSLINDPIRGFWDETSQKLVFYRVVGGGNTGAPPTNLQVFTGYQFLGKLAGSFEAFATSGGLPTKNVFGWYAIH